MKKKGTKHRLKPISLYGHKLEDVIRAFMQVDLNALPASVWLNRHDVIGPGRVIHLT